MLPARSVHTHMRSVSVYNFMSRKALLRSLTGPFAPTGRSEAGDGAGRPGEQQGQEHLPVPAPQADRARLLEGRPGPHPCEPWLRRAAGLLRPGTHLLGGGWRLVFLFTWERLGKVWSSLETEKHCIKHFGKNCSEGRLHLEKRFSLLSVIKVNINRWCSV